MSCVWQGILTAIKHDFSSHMEDEMKHKIQALDIKSVLSLLKNSNRKTPHVTWNKEELSDKLMEDNLSHIDQLDANCLNDGYMCSTCDPIFILLCEIFNINIEHTYINNTMYYEYTHPTNRTRMTYIFKSDHGHFWFVNNRVLK